MKLAVRISTALTLCSALSTVGYADNLLVPARVDAGADQSALSGAKVNLSASIVNAESAGFTYHWEQLSGNKIELIDAGSANASFTAPNTNAPIKVLFKVITSDASGKTYSDSIAVGVTSANSIKRYEAEATSGVALTNVKRANTIAGFSGEGYITGYKGKDSDATAWTITLETAGYYKIEIGYQVDSDKEFLLLIDGVEYNGKMPALDKAFHATSLGTKFIAAGKHEFIVKGGWSYYNLDYLQLTPTAAPLLPQAVDSAPADPNASAKTKALYRYMTSQYGHTTLSGQQDAAETNSVLKLSGKLPAIYALDINRYDKLAVNAQGLPPAGTEDFIRVVSTNKLIGSLIWHWHSPMHALQEKNCTGKPCWWSSFYSTDTKFNLKEALANTDSKEYKALIADIDAIAVQLKKVSAADVPILWRPLHEAEGKWFWWGMSGPESFKTFWRIMHDRLTNHHQLHNLIWVLTNNDTNWYPGDDVVDFIGVDAYPKDKHDSLNGIWSSMQERFDGHKMVALSEYGGVPFINEMQEQGVWWGYFASWNDSDPSAPLGPKKMADGEVKMIYNLPNVITADEVVIPKE